MAAKRAVLDFSDFHHSGPSKFPWTYEDFATVGSGLIERTPQ